jgi:competence protein ComEA
MSPTRRNDRAAPLLLLLLALLSMYCLRQLLHLHGSSSIPSKEMHYVQVGGDVGPPAVYAFSSPPSVEELIATAGIQKTFERGAGSHQIFSSGERLDMRMEGGKVRLTRGEMNGFFKMTLGIPLSINTETESGLTALPDIGPGLARAIVEERSRRGGFKSLEELTSIRGIGYQRFLKIKPFIKL